MQDCHINIYSSRLTATSDLDYWEGKRAIIEIANTTGVKVDGGAIIDGNGQEAWDRYAEDPTYQRPALVHIGDSKDVSFRSIMFHHPPRTAVSVADSKNLTFSRSDVFVYSESENRAQNTTGWVFSNTTDIRMSDVGADRGGDCVALKNGVKNVDIDTLSCGWGKGFAIGSLNGREGEHDVIENVYVKKSFIWETTTAISIRLYPGGYGTMPASISNITFEDVNIISDDYAFQIMQCYGEDPGYCEENPSDAELKDIVLRDVYGDTNEKTDPVVALIDCPEDGICDVTLDDFRPKAPSGKGEILCANVGDDSDIPCTGEIP